MHSSVASVCPIAISGEVVLIRIKWLEQTQPEMAGKAERERTCYWLGKGQAPEAAEAVWLHESAATAKTLEMDRSALAAFAYLDLVE